MSRACLPVKHSVALVDVCDIALVLVETLSRKISFFVDTAVENVMRTGSGSKMI